MLSCRAYSASARLVWCRAPADALPRRLRARMPEPVETIELGLAAGAPVVEIVRTAYTDDGHLAEVSEMIAAAGAYVFRHDFATT